jgi:hypothetical protein
MANLLQSKQIEKFQIAKMGVSAFSAAGTDDVVTTEITTAAGVDGVPVQVGSATTEGFITTGANNKAWVLDATTKTTIDDGLGNEVYGRLTEAAGVYTLSYYSIQSGTETAVTLSATTIDFFVSYNYSFKNLPNDALIRVNSVVVGEDPSGAGGRPIRNEKITVTALNTLANLAKTPIDNTVALYVNGKAEAEGASEAFTRVGKVLTWDATDAEYDLETTDDVVAHYGTLEA